MLLEVARITSAGQRAGHAAAAHPAPTAGGQRCGGGVEHAAALQVLSQEAGRGWEVLYCVVPSVGHQVAAPGAAVQPAAYRSHHPAQVPRHEKRHQPGLQLHLDELISYFISVP